MADTVIMPGQNPCEASPLPGRKDDRGKLRMDLIPPEVMEALAEVLGYGAQKYAPNNWQRLTDFEDRYYAAALRHLMAWRKGTGLDSESGLSHLSHALCCLAFLVWRERQNS